jgi:hypothetical protein
MGEATTSQEQPARALDSKGHAKFGGSTDTQSRRVIGGIWTYER